MEDIKLSIIVLTYNHEKYIKQCLESIISQNVNFKYEVLIGNDNSPDNTAIILNEYQLKHPNIMKIYNREFNLGATKNLLDLLKKASGEYVILLEGDDYWTDNNKLSILVRFLDKNKEYIGVFHKVSEVDEDAKIISTYPNYEMDNNVEEIISVNQFLEFLYKQMGQVIHIQSIMYRNIYKNELDVRTENYLTSGKMIADIHIKLLILSKGKLKYLNRNMGNYRRVRKVGGTSFSSQSKEFLFNETITIWNAINEYYEYKYTIIINKIIQSIYADKIDYYLYTKQYNRINKDLSIFNSFIRIKIIIKSLYMYIKKQVKNKIKTVIR